MTGRRTTCKVVRRRAVVSTGTRDPKRREVRRGVITPAVRVETAVMLMLRATSALARRVTRLEAVPPGQQPVECRLWGERREGKREAENE
jgi:hypothetical protein